MTRIIEVKSSTRLEKKNGSNINHIRTEFIKSSLSHVIPLTKIFW
jgi:hypothetical protein